MLLDFSWVIAKYIQVVQAQDRVNTLVMQVPLKSKKARVPRSVVVGKLKRDKARNALRDSRIGLEIVVLQIAKFLDEFGMVKTDKERAEILNRCIHYLSHNCMGSLNLPQLADCQSELLLLDSQLAMGNP